MMIELKNINVKTGNFTLQNISLQLEAGKFQVLLGPSGSGKTILLETIAGLINPTTGCILFDGNDVTCLPPEKRELSYLPQDNALFPHKNVYENIAFGLKLKGLSLTVINEKVSHITSTLNISHLLNRSVRNLSGGEQQRVALARALVLEKPILILDEPTSSLHETMQENFCLLLKEIQQKYNLTVLMTTHHKDSAFMLADTLHFIENGKLSLSIASSKLYNAPLPLRVAELLGITNVLTMKKISDNPEMFYCTEINTNFKLSNIPDNIPDEFQLGIKPVDIRVIKKEEKHLLHSNSFNATVEQLFFKESDALVFLKIPVTECVIKMELSAYNLKKMDIQKGITIQCKIKEEYTRIIY